ncbi:hypothetical protein EAG21025_18720 [Enterobacter asburiae]|uniref:hypothetical protein n=1 Tax=Enterobacter asburiae TaxID=61645 RepID=UPI0034E8EDCF|nr:hypothetical protein [Enterobacter asburiae]
MADYGAMILMDNGNPFVTPQSTPFCLYGKYTFSSSPNGSSQQVTQYLSIPADYPVMVFIKTTDTAQPTPVVSYRLGGNVYIGGVNPYTRINAGGTSTGTGSPGGGTNTGMSLTAINTTAYD